MQHKLTEVYREAVGAALLTIADLAELSEKAENTVKMYLYTERRVSVAAALAMADALEEHASELEEHAEKLRKVADDERARRERARR